MTDEVGTGLNLRLGMNWAIIAYEDTLTMFYLRSDWSPPPVFVDAASQNNDEHSHSAQQTMGARSAHGVRFYSDTHNIDVSLVSRGTQVSLNCFVFSSTL